MSAPGRCSGAGLCGKNRRHSDNFSGFCYSMIQKSGNRFSAKIMFH